jgi:hypothetical protein
MDDIVPKTNDDAPVTDYVPLFGDWRDEVLFDSVAMALAEYRKRARAEFEESIAPLRLEVAELRGQVSALLTLLGAKAEVIGLPRKRPCDAA